ncbi:MAG: hypothetical protein KGL39_06635 [Patescibacteria group bacterium]|nr:hypothetical protein [Patescibacteria group bacterium]
MADDLSPYQKAMNRLVQSGPEVFKRIDDVLVTRRDELDALWLKELELPFDAQRLSDMHRGTTELTKVMKDLRVARQAFEAQAQVSDELHEDGGGNGTATAY